LVWTSSVLRHWALTHSRPSATLTLIILRVVGLIAALLGEWRVPGDRLQSNRGDREGAEKSPGLSTHMDKS